MLDENFVLSFDYPYYAETRSTSVLRSKVNQLQKENDQLDEELRNLRQKTALETTEFYHFAQKSTNYYQTIAETRIKDCKEGLFHLNQQISEIEYLANTYSTILESLKKDMFFKNRSTPIKSTNGLSLAQYLSIVKPGLAQFNSYVRTSLKTENLPPLRISSQKYYLRFKKVFGGERIEDAILRYMSLNLQRNFLKSSVRHMIKMTEITSQHLKELNDPSMQILMKRKEAELEDLKIQKSKRDKEVLEFQSIFQHLKTKLNEFAVTYTGSSKQNGLENAISLREKARSILNSAVSVSKEKSSEEKLPEDETLEEKPLEENPSEDKTPEEKSSEEKIPEDKTPEEKPLEENPSENKTPEEKPLEENPSKDKTPEENSSEEKPS